MKPISYSNLNLNLDWVVVPFKKQVQNFLVVQTQDFFVFYFFLQFIVKVKRNLLNDTWIFSSVPEMQRKKSYQAQNLLGKNFEKHHRSFSFYYSNTPQDN